MSDHNIPPGHAPAPTAACLSDYLGMWMYDPQRFTAAREAIRRGEAPQGDPRQAVMAIPTIGAQAEEIRTAAGGRYVRYPNGMGALSLVGTLMKGQSKFGGTSTVAARAAIREMADDPKVGSILLVVESPGGTVAGTQELADTVAQANEAKPVHVHIDDLGASAAYWVASQARTVSINEAGLAGSIGAVMVVEDTSKMAEERGVEVIPFVTGPLKGAGAWGTEITAEQREYFQGLVDSAMDLFRSAVIRGRGLDEEQMTAAATGGVFDAKQALALGLVDHIRSLDQTAAAIGLELDTQASARRSRARRAQAAAGALEL